MFKNSKNNQKRISTFYKQKSFLNSDLFINKTITGKIINFDENVALSTLSNDSDETLFEAIFNTLRQTVAETRKINAYKPLLSRFDIKHIINIIDSYETHQKILSLLGDKKAKIFEAFETAFTESLMQSISAQVKTFNQQHSKIIDTYVSYFMSHVRFSITHVLFERITKDIEENFILSVNELIPSIFYEVNPYLKGILYKRVKDVVLLNHFSVNYQIPILKCDTRYDDKEVLTIDISTSDITHSSAEEIFETKTYFKRKQVSHKINRVEDNPRHNVYIYPMIYNYKDVQRTDQIECFQKGLYYIPDYTIVAKGSNLTVDEWKYRFEFMFSKYKGTEIYIRLPRFNQYVKPDEVALFTYNPYDMTSRPEYYENLIKAVAATHKDYPHMKVFLSISSFHDKKAILAWKSTVKSIYTEVHEFDNVSIVFEFNDHKSMYTQQDLMRLGSFVTNLDSLVSDYINQSLLPRDSITLDHLFKYDIYADIQFTRHLQRDHIRNDSLTLFMMGIHLQNEKIFRRMIVAGYRHFIVPIDLPHFIIPTIHQFQATRNSFIGQCAIDIERARFYRQYRMMNNGVLDHKQYGTYKKTKESYLKKVEELKQKKADREKAEKELNESLN